MCSAAVSCTKDETQGTADGKVQVSVAGQICAPAIVGETKASASTIVKLEWTGGETVYAYAGSTKVGELTATIYQNDKQYASLIGTLENVPQGTTVITLIYSNRTVNFDGGKATVDLSSQNSTLPFVICGTMPYKGAGIENELVKFSFATTTVLLTGTGIGTTGTATANINGVNTVCAITPNATGRPVIVGEAIGTIAKTAGITASNDGRFTMNVAIAPDNGSDVTTGRIVEVTRGGKTYRTAYTATKMEAGVAYISVYAYNESEYVTIDGLKWAKQNLAISASGKKSWKGNNSSAVKVPGTDEDVIPGDFFQWAAYEGYCGNAADADKGLLIYDSFKSKGCGDGSNAFVFKFPGPYYYWFTAYDTDDRIGISAYYDKTTYTFTKYTDEAHATLDRTVGYTGHNDDVANIILGGSWRVPTIEEFTAMRQKTYWAWDSNDMGCYVFMPGQGTDGSAGGLGQIAGTDDKSKAVLFFPAAGDGYQRQGPDGNMAYYWSSSLDPSNTRRAHSVFFYQYDVVLTRYSTRDYGLSVRPVSD